MSKEVDVETLFKDLDDFIQKGGENALQSAINTCDKILKIAPEDGDAITCKVVALLQLSKYEEALKYINTLKGSSNFDLERAYCLYRLRDFQKSLDILKKLDHSLPQVLELEAQVYYRLDDYKKSSDNYKVLIDKHNQSSFEVKTNACAALVSGGLVKEGRDFISENKILFSESFEFVYNAACLAIEDGDYNTAEKHLKTAEAMCREAITDEDELQEELAPINTQLAYVYQVQNKTQQAIELYNTVLKGAKPSDESVLAVASNNLVAVKAEPVHDLFDAAKKLKNASSATIDQILSTNQKKIIGFNSCLVQLHMNKGDECSKLLAPLQKQYPDSDRLALISSALLHKKDKKNATASEELLKTFAAQHPENSTRVQLSLAQLRLSKGEVQEAISTLQSINSLKNKPGMVATLVTLYEQTNQIDAAMKVFDDYCDDLASQKNKDEDAYLRALKENANFKLKHRKHREAAAMFERVIKINANDLEALPGLIISYSQFDPKLAEKYDRIPKLDSDKEVDAEALENLAAPKIGSSAKEVDKTSEKTDRVKKSKKKKKKKLPKNYNPSIPPDPERWVPLKQRTAFKKRTSRKSKGLEKGAQGVSTAEKKPGYDRTTIKPSKQEEVASPKPSTPTTSATSTPKEQPKQASNNNNKKKGRKGK